MILKKNILYLLFFPSTCLYADRYIEDEIGGGGSDSILIYLILIVVGWLAISTIINAVKDAIRQTKVEIDTGRLPIKAEIRKHIKLLIKQEIKSLPLTLEDYLLNIYVYGLGFILGGLFGALSNVNQISIENVLWGATFIGIPWCLVFYLILGRGVSEANKQKIRAKYSQYKNLPNDIEKLRKIRDHLLNKKN
ncbi:hypothetical protein [Acinetobacter guillouiae]|uniref:Uncharacterized protein n=1 Tax=Acinetobacter guillouiae NIPH 991 TaxID=1217656 RepID=N8WWH1_ACIGI|nr:hypothetical protein [Acinetobacter guillouiae]ENV16482.1 hypothetical protein F964_03417 [Acinetobacter guillouiae NIPH 991]